MRALLALSLAVAPVAQAAAPTPEARREFDRAVATLQEESRKLRATTAMEERLAAMKRVQAASDAVSKAARAMKGEPEPVSEPPSAPPPPPPPDPALLERERRIRALDEQTARAYGRVREAGIARRRAFREKTRAEADARLVAAATEALDSQLEAARLRGHARRHEELLARRQEYIDRMVNEKRNEKDATLLEQAVAAGLIAKYLLIGAVANLFSPRPPQPSER